MSGEGSIDEAAEREAQEHADRQPDDVKATPDKVNGREVLDGSRTVDEDETRDEGQGPVEEPPS